VSRDERGFILAGDVPPGYGRRPGDTTLIDQQPSTVFDPYLHRRRASDRARERAGRAALYGDRAGLLIATSTAASLMSVRARSGEPVAGPEPVARPD
jgi:hypothetical protein